MANNLVERTITANSQWSDTLRVGRNRRLNVSVNATAMTATIALQRKPLGTDDTAFRTIATYTANAEKIVESVGQWEYRIGSTAFTSATALNVQLLM